MSTIDYSRELEAAIVAVRAAAVVCQSVQKNLVPAATLEKEDHSPVTVADFASQALVCASLLDHSSVRAVVGEESSAPLRAAGSEETRDEVIRQVRRVHGEATGTDQALDWIDMGGVTPTGSQRTSGTPRDA